MEAFLLVATQTGVLFALMAAGAACRFFRLVDDSAERGMVNVLVLLVTPCLIVDCFQRPFNPDSLSSLAIAFALAAASHAALVAAASFAWRRRRGDDGPVFKLATVFSNAGFMGIPLEQALFGADGVFFGTAYVVVFNIFIWTWGLGTVRKSGRGGPGGAARFAQLMLNPGVLGVAVALPLFLFSVRLPAVVAGGVRHMSALNTPLAMIAVGYRLAGADFGALLRRPAAHAVAAARLVLHPVLFALALFPFKGMLDRTMMLSLVTAASAPVAAMVAMFASKHGRDADLAVGLVAWTTLASMATMPATISFAMRILS